MSARKWRIHGVFTAEYDPVIHRVCIPGMTRPFTGMSTMRCHYCEKVMPFQESTLDHLIPLSRGGRNSPANFVLSRLPCNQWKADDIVVEVSALSE